MTHSHTFSNLEIFPPSKSEFIDFLIHEFNNLPKMELKYMFNLTTAEYFYHSIGPNFDILNSYYIYKLFYTIVDFVDMRVNDEYERISKIMFDWKADNKIAIADDCMKVLCHLRKKSIKLDLKTTVNEHICIKALTRKEIIQQTESHYYQINYKLSLAAINILCET